MDFTIPADLLEQLRQLPGAAERTEAQLVALCLEAGLDCLRQEGEYHPSQAAQEALAQASAALNAAWLSTSTAQRALDVVSGLIAESEALSLSSVASSPFGLRLQGYLAVLETISASLATTVAELNAADGAADAAVLQLSRKFAHEQKPKAK